MQPCRTVLRSAPTSFALVIGGTLMCLSSEARVTRIVIDDRQPLATAAGQTIVYEQISGRAFRRPGSA